LLITLKHALASLELQQLSSDEMLEKRYQKFRAIGEI